MAEAGIVQFQQKQEARFLCSACGADRGCNCNAPAVEKLAERLEQDRQRARRAREKKAEQYQQSRHVTEAPQPQPILGPAGRAKVERLVEVFRNLNAAEQNELILRLVAISRDELGVIYF